VRLLLDTVALIRWDQGRVGESVRRSFDSADAVIVSVVSLWELAMKHRKGTLRLHRDIGTHGELYGFQTLEMTGRHVARFLGVPAHHNDPFDRMLIAQALEEGLTIVTSDRAFEQYRVPLIEL
jgi:PIN domain nuclease of toxin-antitoxin system